MGLTRLTRRLREAGFNQEANQRLVVVRQAREYFIADASTGSLRSLRPEAAIGGAAAESANTVVQRLIPIVEENVRGRAAP
jgi:Tfp pilus assembly protein PilW